MTQDTPSRSLDKVIVRLPDGMRDRIREAAENNNRSMNAEIVERLESSFINERRIQELIIQRDLGMEQQVKLSEDMARLSQRLNKANETISKNAYQAELSNSLLERLEKMQETIVRLLTKDKPAPPTKTDK